VQDRVLTVSIPGNEPLLQRPCFTDGSKEGLADQFPYYSGSKELSGIDIGNKVRKRTVGKNHLLSELESFGGKKDTSSWGVVGDVDREKYPAKAGQRRTLTTRRNATAIAWGI
jgi:hypothetical protein